MSASRQDGGDGVSRDELLAYADGRLPEGAVARIEAHLAAHPEAAAELADWQAQNRALERLYPRQEAERRVAGLLAGRRRPAGAPWPARLAAALVLLSLGLGGGWLARGLLAPPVEQAQLADLVDEAMAAHAIYSAEVLHPVEVTAASEAHLVGWLSKRLGARIVAPDLSAAGFRLMGGRLLPAGARAAAQFMYEDDSGRRVTIYAAPAPPGRLAAFEVDEKDGLTGIYWRDEALEYAVVGPLARNELMRLAGEVYRQLI